MCFGWLEPLVGLWFLLAVHLLLSYRYIFNKLEKQTQAYWKQGQGMDRFGSHPWIFQVWSHERNPFRFKYLGSEKHVQCWCIEISSLTSRNGKRHTNYRHREIYVTINNSENQAPVLGAYHQAPNLENVGQKLQNCASLWKQNLVVFFFFFNQTLQYWILINNLRYFCYNINE